MDYEVEVTTQTTVRKTYRVADVSGELEAMELVNDLSIGAKTILASSSAASMRRKTHTSTSRTS